jgi:glucans biosynthesis protein C
MDEPRRHDIDRLRVFATLLLLPFHTAKIYDTTPFYHVKDTELSAGLSYLTSFVHLWHMPLFFLLAGWSLCASLRRRGETGMVHERVSRLFVPFAAGIVLFAPLIKYFELRNGQHMGIHGLATVEPLSCDTSILGFYGTFFSDPTMFTWSHLWFLIYLFTFTMLYRRRLIGWLAQAPAVLERPSVAGLWKPLLVLVAIQVLLRPIWPGGLNLVWDWANFAYYSSFFLAGFALALRPAWQEVVDGQRHRVLVVGLAAAGACGFILASLGRPLFEGPISAGLVARLLPMLALSAVAGWALVLALLGYAHVHANRPGPSLAHLSEASLPLYVLHQAAIVVPGFLLVGMPWGIPAKFALTLGAATVITFAVYELAVRPWRPARLLFGMSVPARAPQPARLQADAGSA